MERSQDNEKSFLPRLPLKAIRGEDELQRRIDSLSWFHQIDFGSVVTKGYPYDAHWSWVAEQLQAEANRLRNRTVLELGPADGLWSCWLTKLGVKSIVAADVANRDEYRLVIESFGLPVEYFADLLSTDTPRAVKRLFDGVVSLGVLYHVHDPLTTLIMYQRYLKPGGFLILEGGTIFQDEPGLYYTGNGLVYGHDGGNQFIPTRGFLEEVLERSLGFRIERFAFRKEYVHPKLGKEVGRSLIVAVKEGLPNVHCYPLILQSLGMYGEEFGPFEWLYPWPPSTGR